MPSPSLTPTTTWIEFKGYTYLVYQGAYGGIVGTGPVPMWWRVGIIARTADGAVWQTVFNGTATPPTGVGYTMPGTLYVRNDTLYCVVYQGGWSYVDGWSYLGAGEIATWKTTDGFFWNKHQVLVSWPAAGSGESVGGLASQVAFAPAPVWRAAGSGPAGQMADWLIVGYHAYANVPGAPVVHTATPQYRSLDGGETWVQIRNMKGVYPFLSNPHLPEGPASVLAAPRPGVATDRWVMVGGNSFVNYSDDLGATWTASGGVGTPSYGLSVPSGGMLFPRHGGITTGPHLEISCDFGGSRVGAPSPPVGGNNALIAVLPFGPTVAGGEEMLASTGPGARLWHSTNGGETWTDRGTVPVGFGTSYGFARAPNGRILLFPITGVGGVADLWTCDDAPSGIPTPRLVCPFVVEPPDNVGPPPPCPPAWGFTPVPCAQPCPTTPEGAEIAALLAPILARRRALYTPRFPEFTCARPLGAFVLGSHCLGVLPPVSVTTPPYERDGTCLLTGLEVFTNAPCPPTPVPGPRI